MPLFRRRRERWVPPEPLCAFLVACPDDPAEILASLDAPDFVEVSVHAAGQGVGIGPELWERMGAGEELRARLARARFHTGLALAGPVHDVGEAVLAVTRFADELAELAGGGISDLAAQRMYLPGGWRMDEPIGELDAREHVQLHFVTDGELPVWVHTHGLAKFGRPELEAFDVPEDDVQAVARALLEIGQYTMEGALISPGETVSPPDIGVVRAAVGEREREHWGDFAVLELALVPDQG